MKKIIWPGIDLMILFISTERPPKIGTTNKAGKLLTTVRMTSHLAVALCDFF